MSVPSLQQCMLTRPCQEHGSVAAAQVPALSANDPHMPNVLGACGFTALDAHRYVARDGSWVQLDAQRNTLERGVGNVHFSEPVQPLGMLSAVPFTATAHRCYAVAYLPALPAGDPAGATAALLRAGFAQVLPTYFSHGDGSWVALTGGKLEAGVGTVRLVDFPPPGTGQRPAAGERPQHRVHTSLPFPDDWQSWRRCFAVAKLPRADGTIGVFTTSQLATILTYLGFTPTGVTTWTHPEGSRVITDGGGRLMALHFQSWSFDRFPYSATTDHHQVVADTQQWMSWVQDPSAARAPFPSYCGPLY